jgi:hypothetical protein
MFVTWVRRGLSPVCYDFEGDGRPLGSLTWVSRSGSAAIADLAGQIFILRKGGFIRPRLVVETVASGILARASLPSMAKSGNIRFADGKRFSFRINESLEWLGREGEKLARIAPPNRDGVSGMLLRVHEGDGSLAMTLIVAGLYIQHTLGAGERKGSWRSGRIGGLL